MKPQRVVTHRAHSPLALHKDEYLTVCDHALTLRLTDFTRGDGLVEYRCDACDNERLDAHQFATALQSWPVLPEPRPEYQEDAGDIDDFREGWLG